MRNDGGAEENRLVIMDFTHVYEQHVFYQDREHDLVRCSDIQGTFGYCDDEAAGQLREKIREYGPGGVHFLDSGNYHYVSRFWTEKVDEDFVLVLFDHHTDAQPSSFGEILTCGSWVRDVVRTNPHLRKVVMIGPPREAFGQIEEELRQRIFCLPEEDMAGSISEEDMAENTVEAEKCLAQVLDGLSCPLYLSVDKDVLSPKTVRTDWDQGELAFPCLEELLRFLAGRYRVIGADICGESPADSCPEDISGNDAVNARLLELLCQPGSAILVTPT